MGREKSEPAQSSDRLPGGLRGIKKKERKRRWTEFFSSPHSPGRWQKDTLAKQMFSRDMK